MEREKQLEKYLRLRIEERGGACLKFVSPGQDGVPDRIIILPGSRVYFVELKTQTGKLSRIQKYQLKKLVDLGQCCCVVYGKSGVNDFLKDIDSWIVGSYVYGGLEGDLVYDLEDEFDDL